MTSDDTSDASDEVSVPKETTLSSTHVAKESPAAAVAKPELHPRLGEDGDEWEGFYEEGDWEEL